MKKVRGIARIVFCLMMALILGVVGYNIVMKRFHPVEYSEQIIQYSKEFDISPSLVAAVIKCESSFDKSAVSAADARGLMQLTEETFTDVRKMLKDGDDVTFEEKWDDADTNIRYGTRYLRFLLDMFDGDVTAAIASYNAGLGNVKNWMGEDHKLTVDEIEFDETFNYVDKVLNAEKYYRKHYR